VQDAFTEQGCLACDLTSGRTDLPGGRIHATEHWVVEHCVGPLGVGTLIVKPARHTLHIWELTEAEGAELGPLLRRAAGVVRALTEPEQVYVCLWSHADWRPGHIHFVVQPAPATLRDEHKRPGPFLQSEQFDAGTPPARDQVEAFAASARALFET